MEYLEETIDRLRKKLGRDPTDAEIKAERDRKWKLAYADMAFTAICFADEEGDPQQAAPAQREAEIEAVVRGEDLTPREADLLRLTLENHPQLTVHDTLRGLKAGGL